MVDFLWFWRTNNRFEILKKESVLWGHWSQAPERGLYVVVRRICIQYFFEVECTFMFCFLIIVNSGNRSGHSYWDIMHMIQHMQRGNILCQLKSQSMWPLKTSGRFVISCSLIVIRLLTLQYLRWRVYKCSCSGRLKWTCSPLWRQSWIIIWSWLILAWLCAQ